MSKPVYVEINGLCVQAPLKIGDGLTVNVKIPDKRLQWYIEPIGDKVYITSAYDNTTCFDVVNDKIVVENQPVCRWTKKGSTNQFWTIVGGKIITAMGGGRAITVLDKATIVVCTPTTANEPLQTFKLTDAEEDITLKLVNKTDKVVSIRHSERGGEVVKTIPPHSDATILAAKGAHYVPVGPDGKVLKPNTINADANKSVDITEDVVVPPAPTPILNWKQNEGKLEVILSWTLPAGTEANAASYVLVQRLPATSEQALPASPNEFVVKDVEAKKYYEYVLVAKNAAGAAGPESRPVKFRLTPPSPAKPVLVYKLSDDGKKVTLTWKVDKNGGSEIQSYSVIQTSPPVGGKPYHEYEVKAPTNELTLDVVPGTAYQFSVSATNADDNESPASNTVEFTPVAPPAPPAPTPILNWKQNDGKLEVTLFWSLPAGTEANVNSYVLVQRLPAKSEKTLLASPTEFVVKDVEARKYYEYVLVARNADGTPGPESRPVKFRLTPPSPGRPVLEYKLSPDGKKVTLSWKVDRNGGSEIKTYSVIQTSPPVGGKAYHEYEVKAPTTELTLDVVEGTTYQFMVSATNADDNESPSSNIVEFTPVRPAPPSAPTLAYDFFSPDRVVLRIIPPAKGPVTEYILYRTLYKPKSFSIGLDTVIEQNIPNPTNYGYYVVAVNEFGQSPPSNTVVVKRDNTLSPPGAPELSHALTAATSARLVWTVPTAGGSTITKYTIVREKPSPETIVVDGSTTSLKVLVVPGQTYTYSVYASNAIGDGKPSATITVQSNVNQNQNVEVVFSFDTTGSMYPCLEQVRGNISAAVTRLFKDISNLRVAVIAHGDYTDAGTSYLLKVFDFSRDVGQIVSFVNSVGKTGGGDAPEAYEKVLRDVRNLSWTPGFTKALVLIGDDLPHTVDQNPERIDWRVECGELDRRDIRAYTVQCLGRAYATPFYSDVARLTGAVHVNLDNFATVTDLIIALCYVEHSSASLKGFAGELKAAGRLTGTLTSLITKAVGSV